MSMRGLAKIFFEGGQLPLINFGINLIDFILLSGGNFCILKCFSMFCDK